MKYVKKFTFVIALALFSQGSVFAMKRGGEELEDERNPKRVRGEPDPSVPPKNGDCYLIDYPSIQTNLSVPTDVLELVFANLDPQDLWTCNQVCKAMEDLTPKATDQNPYPVEITCIHLARLTNLVSDGSHFIQANQAAQLGMRIKNVHIQSWVIELFIALVQQRYAPAFSPASKAADHNIQSRSFYVSCRALRLLADLEAIECTAG